VSYRGYPDAELKSYVCRAVARSTQVSFGVQIRLVAVWHGYCFDTPVRNRLQAASNSRCQARGKAAQKLACKIKPPRPRQWRRQQFDWWR
jgi:hypothetical protein